MKTKTIIESFSDPSSRIHVENAPSSFNGIVNIRRYRITVEEIDEPEEVLIERLKVLWADCDNHHEWGPMKWHADQLGITLDMARVGINKRNPGPK